MVVKVFFKEDMYVHCFFKQNAATHLIDFGITFIFSGKAENNL